MNILKPIAMSTAILVAGAANASDANNETIIDKPVFNSHDGVFSIEALQALGRVSSPVLSPDKKKVLYGISYESVEENCSNNDLYVMNIDGTEQGRITRTTKSESNAVWINNGNKSLSYIPKTMYYNFGL